MNSLLKKGSLYKFFSFAFYFLEQTFGLFQKCAVISQFVLFDLHASLVSCKKQKEFHRHWNEIKISLLSALLINSMRSIEQRYGNKTV